MKYSFIVPIYNDGFLARSFVNEFYMEFSTKFKTGNIDDIVELIFVNDGSKDESMNQLCELTREYKFVKVIELSRNFGQHIALTAGYELASGEFVGMLNVDMQEHPREIFKLLNLIEKIDFDIVYGLREENKNTFINSISSKVFNILLNKLTGNNTPLNISTLRIMNRKFLNAYLQLTEKSRYLPGLEDWLGYKKGYASISHSERKEGKSSYTLKKRLLLAIDSIISFSDLPLKITALLGMVIAIIGFLLSSFLIISKMFFINYKHGFTSTISVTIFLGGVQIMVTGLAAVYVGRILKEVQNRPLYLIRNKYNFN